MREKREGRGYVGEFIYRLVSEYGFVGVVVLYMLIVVMVIVMMKVVLGMLL
jgi:hypothetical protein